MPIQADWIFLSVCPIVRLSRRQCQNTLKTLCTSYLMIRKVYGVQTWWWVLKTSMHTQPDSILGANCAN